MKTPYAFVIQILEKLGKISDLMHLYFHSEVFTSFFAFFHLKTAK